MKASMYLAKLLASVIPYLAFAPPGLAATWYVAPDGNDAADGTSWATAKQTIQAAIDRTGNGDLVLATNGTYAGHIVITNGITLQSVNGADYTILTGGGSQQAAYLNHASALLTGCTITGGTAYAGGGVYIDAGTLSHCTISGNWADQDGGGVHGGTLNYCLLTGNGAGYGGGGAYQSTLNHCVISGNMANAGGGVFESILNYCILSDNMAIGSEGGIGGGSFGGTTGGTLNNCTLSGNSAELFGGGSAYDTLNNCILSGNSAYEGGGVFASTLNNCTLSGNSANGSAGGTYQCTLNNCIVYWNSAWDWGTENHKLSTFNYSCTAPHPGGTGNISDDPQFMDAGSSNFHLSASSPCIDKGNNTYAPGLYDLDGHPRIMHGTVDMGAYEMQGYWAWVGAITNGLTNYNDCATGDGYPNLLKYATGSSPTNSDTLARLSSALTNHSAMATLFKRNTNAYDVMFIVEAGYGAANNASWNGIATNLNGSWGDTPNVLETGTSTPVSVRVQDPIDQATNRFMRLRLMRP